MPRTSAIDNIDGDISDEVVVSIAFCAKNDTSCANPAVLSSNIIQGGALPSQALKLQLDTFSLGQYHINYTATDHAGLYGRDAQSNVAKTTSIINVIDTTPPTLYCNKQTCALAAGAAVKKGVFDEHLLRTVEKVSTADACCSLCEKMNATEANTCGFFSYVSEHKTCHTFRTSLKTLNGNVVADEGAVSGFPIGCQVQNSHECGAEYADPGAQCVDTHDSWTIFGVDVQAMNSEVQSAGKVHSASPGVNTIEYGCADKSGNVATEAKRYIDVVDTTPPVLSVMAVVPSTPFASDSKCNRLITVQRGIDDVDETLITGMIYNYQCIDSCPEQAIQETHTRTHSKSYTIDRAGETIHSSKSHTASQWSRTIHSAAVPRVSTQWTLNGVNVPHLDPTVVGHYVLKYTCADSVGNEVSKSRTVINQDRKKPVVNPNGDDFTVYSGGRTGVYKDEGATCKSPVDGLIDEKITTSGHVVEVDTPGTYLVHYHCTGSSGEQAGPATRAVIAVQYDACPVCELVGEANLSLEAGFRWDDPQAHCTSDQGSVALNTVATGEVDMFAPGTYVVTYTATDSTGHTNNGKHCIGQNVATRTVVVQDSMEPYVLLKDKMTGPDDISEMVVSDQASRQSTTSRNGGLMTEKVEHMNGWIVAAAICGAAGLALIGFFTHTQEQRESVPV
jgi:hypothetical protein